MLTFSASVAFFAVLLTWIIWKLARIGQRESTLPPGPPTVALLGNVHLLPTQSIWMKLTEWAREYGDFYSLKLGSDTAIVLTSMKAVKELLDQQSGLTSDRPKSYFAETTFEGLHAATMSYNNTLRLFRKTMQPMLNSSGAIQHQPIQIAEATQLMHDLLHSPNMSLLLDLFMEILISLTNHQRVYTHLERYSTSVTTSIVFGKRFPEYDCAEVEGIFQSLNATARIFEPGAHPPVDQLPILNYIPDRWAKWKRMAKWGNRLVRRIYFHLLSVAEDRVRDGKENGSFLEGVIKRREEYGLTRREVAFLGGVLLEGGVHTTSLFLQWMILSLIAFPEVQKKAQEEMDRVIGQERAPRLEDFADLPYCRALVNELHRFRPVAPISIPHAMLDDGTYRNCFLLKGTTLFMNAWGIYHDPDVYENPEIFNPDRYLQNEFGAKPGVDVSDFRNNIIFGSGRRICPGIHVANTSLALNAMNLLWAFHFSPAIDSNTGKPVPVNILDLKNVSAVSFVNPNSKDLFLAPKSFSCSIKPRSVAHAAIIEEEFLAARTAFEKFESAPKELERVDEVFV
ncbi:hypothetical protein D9758_008555 [Tetrapyrgos nigripes]|uniref:Cytochrome P450 n=1 Tax=Tetrapyrgos nigripes TaxID=182062 RepID=A0A8H5G5P6_9AGAR|nr:hypothetical protein D9758_008555 [Tetrapyrgos nigripes]